MENTYEGHVQAFRSLFVALMAVLPKYMVAQSSKYQILRNAIEKHEHTLRGSVTADMTWIDTSTTISNEITSYY